MKAHFTYYQMAYVRGFILFYVGFQTTLQTSTANLNWASLGGFERAIIILGSIGGGLGAVGGFLDKTMGTLDKTRPQEVTATQKENG